MGLPEVLAQAKKYYANIVMPYSRHVQKALKSFEGCEVDMIAPATPSGAAMWPRSGGVRAVEFVRPR
ncbi:MAG: hypothetical protein ACLSVD_10715 [Eggerthellaceae bacterium]